MTLWRRFSSRHRPFKLTKPGWVFILYTIGVGAGAINTGNNLLYLVFGIFLGLLLASGVLSDLSLWKVDVDFSLIPFTQAQEKVLIPFQLTNKKRYFPSLAVNLEVEGHLNGQVFSFFSHVPYIPSHEIKKALLPVVLPYRGVFTVSKIQLRTQYPFGLLKKWWVVDAGRGNQQNLFVLPLRQAIPDSFLSGWDHRNHAGQTTSKKGEGTHLFGIRNYQFADHPRTIHWKASAKKMGSVDEQFSWLVREMESEKKPAFQMELPAPDDVKSLSKEKIERLIQKLYSLWEKGHARGSLVQFFYVLRGGERQIVRDVPKFMCLWQPQEDLDQTLKTYLDVAGDYMQTSSVEIDWEEILHHGD